MGKRKKILVQHESYECKWGLNKRACNSKQKWNPVECPCDSKELDDWSFSENDYMWNPSACDCECNKVYEISEYLDIKNCSCEKRLIDKLVLPTEDEILTTTETSSDDKKSNM